MDTHAQALNRQYGRTGLDAFILAALGRAGKDVRTLDRDDLAAFDEFHIGGRNVTRALARLADLRADTHVLDAGCGVGGPARTLAAEFGCRVTGIDLVGDYCRTAEMLTERVGLGGRVQFQQADAADLPFPRSTFDAVWCQHVTMNVARKSVLFGELRRVLRRGGTLVLYEVCAGEPGAVSYPVPWASDPGLSFLVTPELLREAVARAGFYVRRWEDVTASARSWFARQEGRRRDGESAPALGLDLLMGEDTPQKIANMMRNLEAERFRVITAIATATTTSA